MSLTTSDSKPWLKDLIHFGINKMLSAFRLKHTLKTRDFYRLKGETICDFENTLLTFIVYIFYFPSAGYKSCLTADESTKGLANALFIYKQNIVFSRLGNSFNYGVT